MDAEQEMAEMRTTTLMERAERIYKLIQGVNTELLLIARPYGFQDGYEAYDEPADVLAQIENELKRIEDQANILFNLVTHMKIRLQ